MMKIESFKRANHVTVLREADETGRPIAHATFRHVTVTGRTHRFPNALLFADGRLFSPYDEKVMSLKKDSFYDNDEFSLDPPPVATTATVQTPVFFFIYNVENYFHFLYDTLSYLPTYFLLKQSIPSLKLLVNFPGTKTSFFPFSLDLLAALVDVDRDTILHQPEHVYAEMHVSTSLTHGGHSNRPPRPEVNAIYASIKSRIFLTTVFSISLPRRVYISRRTWRHGDRSNIGTDYTTRRTMVNEDALVADLASLGFSEMFPETMSLETKVRLFHDADVIVGSIGGGMANLLFATKRTKAIVLVTPHFLDINARFRYCLDGANTFYFDGIRTVTQKNRIPLYCRVRMKASQRIGEICAYGDDEHYVVQLSRNDVVGFSRTSDFETVSALTEEFDLLDHGLNSPHELDLEAFHAFLSGVLDSEDA